MSVDFRYPNITGASEKEQLTQIKSFLRQLVDQLNYAFSVLEGGTAGQSGQDSSSYDALKNQLMTEIQRLNNRINGLTAAQSDEQTANEEE